jgi:hypothetical protein
VHLARAFPSISIAHPLLRFAFFPSLVAVRNSYRTTLCLQYPPHQIGLGALFLASLQLGMKPVNPNPRSAVEYTWYELLEPDLEDDALKSICNQIMDVLVDDSAQGVGPNGERKEHQILRARLEAACVQPLAVHHPSPNTVTAVPPQAAAVHNTKEDSNSNNNNHSDSHSHSHSHPGVAYDSEQQQQQQQADADGGRKPRVTVFRHTSSTSSSIPVPVAAASSSALPPTPHSTVQATPPPPPPDTPAGEHPYSMPTPGGAPPIPPDTPGTAPPPPPTPPSEHCERVPHALAAGAAASVPRPHHDLYPQSSHDSYDAPPPFPPPTPSVDVLMSSSSSSSSSSSAALRRPHSETVDGAAAADDDDEAAAAKRARTR